MLRKWILFLYWIAVVGTFAAACVTPSLRAPIRKEQAKARFINRWTNIFRDCKTREEMAERARKEPRSFFHIWELDGADWIVAIAHDFHAADAAGDAGDAWDAAVFCDCWGRISTTDKHICGDGALAAQISKQIYPCLREFYKEPPWPLTPAPNVELTSARDTQ